MGGLTVAMPEEAIAIGANWSVPRTVKVRTEAGEPKDMECVTSIRLKGRNGCSHYQRRTASVDPNRRRVHQRRSWFSSSATVPSDLT